MQVHLARWVTDHTPPTARLGLNDVGAIAYFSRREIVDVMGLVTPAVLPYRREGEAGVLRGEVDRAAITRRCVSADGAIEGPADDLATVRHRRPVECHERVVDEIRKPGRGPGVAFDEPTPEALTAACDAAISAYEAGGAAWDGLISRGMAVDFGWTTGSAPRYVEACARAIAIRAEAGGAELSR